MKPKSIASLLALSLFACGGSSQQSLRQQQALDAARRCATAAPFHGKGIHGSRLMLDKGRVEQSDDAGDVVHFPEEQPRGSPKGLTLLVDSESHECKQLPID